MEIEEKQKKQSELIEEMGVFFEKCNFPPTAGRIIGLLMVKDKLQYSFEEIVEELQISKSSASTAIQMLLMKKCIEYKTLPGDRKRYFTIKQSNKNSFLEDFETKIEAINSIISKIIALSDDSSSEKILTLKRMFKMHEILDKYIKEIKNEFLNICTD